MIFDLSNTGYEFRLQQGPRERSALHHLSLAVESAGTDCGDGYVTELLAADPQAPVCEILERAGLDVELVATELRRLQVNESRLRSAEQDVQLGEQYAEMGRSMHRRPVRG